MVDTWKIRKLLHGNYYLDAPSLISDETDWALYIAPDGYMVPGMGPIISSKNTNVKGLVKFAKKHKQYNIHGLFNVSIWVTIIAMWLCLFIKPFVSFKDILDGMWLGLLIAYTGITIPYVIFIKHNRKVSNLMFKERLNGISQDLEEYDENKVGDNK